MTSKEQPEKSQDIATPKAHSMSEQELSSLSHAENDLQRLLGDTSDAFKQLGRAIIRERNIPIQRRHYLVEIITDKDSGFQSAIVKQKDTIIYSTGELGEIEILKLISEGKDFAIEYFMSEDPLNPVKKDD